MLRHKAAIQAGRYAFGFSGIIDPDEADRLESVTANKAPEIQMPRAKPKPDPVAEAPRLTAQATSVETRPRVDATTPGIFGLSESLERLLMEEARIAGVSREQLLKRYPHIDAGNYKDIRAELQAMASAE
jgi:hypothetical protein